MFLLSGSVKTFSVLEEVLTETQSIKGFVFDVDGTLYHQLPLRVLVMASFLFSHLTHPKAGLRKLRVISGYRRAQEKLRAMNHRHGDSNNAQIALTAESTGESAQYVTATVVAWFEQKPLKFLRACRRKALISSMQRLAARGFKIGVYSDYPAREKVEALGISDLIAATVSSDEPEVHGFKPHSDGFGIAAQRLGLQPSEIVYVGDRCGVDERGARQAGMRAVIVKGFFKTKYIWIN